MSNAAFINALMEEGTKQDCLEQVVKLWNENCELRKQLVKRTAALERIAKWADLKEPEPNDRMSGEEQMCAEGNNSGLQYAGTIARTALTDDLQKGE